MSAHHLSLRDRQVASIQRVLHLNHPIDPLDGSHEQTNGLASHVTPVLGDDGEPVWKVLVFDNLGRDVISSVLRVSDLRDSGVTIHLNINTTRHSIPDVPVIYLVEPTNANLQIIVSDLSRSLYSPAYINFLSSVPRPLLEDFAGQVASTGVGEHLAQLYDQYLNFIVTEPDLFSLGMGNDSYWIMNSAETSDEVLDAAIDRIVSGLFSVVVTMGSIPIIRCPKGGAAEMIAAKLDRKLRDHVLNSKDNLFSAANQKNASSGAASSSRPVLIIVDRNVDLVPMLSHSWTYQSLMADILKTRLNRIEVQVPVDESNPAKGNIKKTYDLTANDFFWTRNAGEPFPQVAEDVATELTKYQEEAQEITKKTGVSSLEDLQPDSGISALHLKAAIEQLPKLQERKAIVDMHMNIATALLKAIGDRQLDKYYELEENITKQSKAQILEIINDQERGKEPLDKLRLFIIWYLSTEQDVSRAEMDRFEEALRSAGATTTALAYIKRVRELTKMTMLSTAPTQQTTQTSTSNDLFKGFSSLSSRLTDRFKEANIGANLDGLISGVKNFLPANKDLTLTKITESIMDPQNASSSAIAKTETYLYFDPRSANARGTMPQASAARQQNAQGVSRGVEASFGQRRQGFSEAIVFTVGGGSMDEYGNLQSWAKHREASGTAPRRRIIYGSTELVNAEDFVNKELARLGQESN